MSKLWKKLVAALFVVAAILLVASYLSFRQQIAPSSPPPLDPHIAIREQIFLQAMDEGNTKETALQRVREYNQTLIRDSQRKKKALILALSAGAAFLAGLTLWTIHGRKKLNSRRNKIIPQTLRAKQLAILLLAGSWCSACCVYQAFNPKLMHHPINAAVTALLFSAPALIFGAVFLWWLSQAKNID